MVDTIVGILVSSVRCARDSNGVDWRGDSIPLERLRLYGTSATGTEKDKFGYLCRLFGLCRFDACIFLSLYGVKASVRAQCGECIAGCCGEGFGLAKDVLDLCWKILMRARGKRFCR